MLQLKNGDRITCTINGVYVDDAVVYQSSYDRYWFIFQNKQYGSAPKEGIVSDYNCSWTIGDGSDLPIIYSVTDIVIVDENIEDIYL